MQPKQFAAVLCLWLIRIVLGALVATPFVILTIVFGELIWKFGAFYVLKIVGAGAGIVVVFAVFAVTIGMIYQWAEEIVQN